MVKLSKNQSFDGLLDSLRVRSEEWNEYFKVIVQRFSLEPVVYVLQSALLKDVRITFFYIFFCNRHRQV